MDKGFGISVDRWNPRLKKRLFSVYLCKKLGQVVTVTKFGPRSWKQVAVSSHFPIL